MVPAPSSTRTPSFAVESPIETDRRAMTVATALFFMVGFITCLNDVIIPHLKSIFELTYAEAMLVQFAFFSSYFVFSYPGGKVVDWLGYKRAMVIGLLIISAGAIGFIPGTCSFGHVRFARRRYLRLHHVPVHLHLGHSGAWPAHQQGFQPDDRSYCWWSRYALIMGKLADHIGLQQAFLVPALCYV